MKQSKCDKCKTTKAGTTLWQFVDAKDKTKKVKARCKKHLNSK